MTNAPNILLLDQDDVLRKATALLLSHRGAGVSLAATLEEAISLSRHRVHDVVLIDISPSMPGAPELLRRLQREGIIPPKIVLSTSVPLSTDEASSFSRILLKPYPFDQLMMAIFGEAAAGVEPELTPARWRARRARSIAGCAHAGRVLRSPRRAARGRPHPG